MKITIPIDVEMPNDFIDKMAEKLIDSGNYIPVVFCEDCKFFDGLCWCNVHEKAYGVFKHDFCSLAERKEND